MTGLHLAYDDGNGTGSPLSIEAYHFNQMPTCRERFFGENYSMARFSFLGRGCAFSTLCLCLSNDNNAHIKRCFSYLLRFRGFLSACVCCFSFVAICHGRNRVTKGTVATRGEFIIKRPRLRMRLHKANQIHKQGDLHLDGCPDDWQAFISPSEIRNKQNTVVIG